MAHGRCLVHLAGAPLIARRTGLRLARHAFTALPLVALAGLLFAALFVAGDAESDVSRLGRWAPWLAFGAVLAVLALLATIARQVWKLLAQRRAGAPGARLASRLTLALALLVVPPLAIVYGFSIKFLNTTIDSWFNVRVAEALDDALALGQLYIDEQLARVQRETEALAGTLDVDDPQGAVDAAIDRTDALQLAVFSESGTLVASAAADPRYALPVAPDADTALRLRSGATLAQAEPSGEDLVLRVLRPLPDGQLLQAIHPLPARSQPLARRLEASYYDYQQLAYLRGSLKLTFTLILSAVLLLSLLIAVRAALVVARRQVRPIARLASATSDIAAGRFVADLPSEGADELGFLTDSFNRMGRELATRRAEAEASRIEIETQRAYLEAVLARLSSGVLTFGDDTLRTANPAADAILGVALAASTDLPLATLAEAAPRLRPLVATLIARQREGAREWREELRLPREGDDGVQVLMLRGTELPGGAGEVVVFDDLTVLNQAQREAAWAEVAQRLAHEVKNPLTPIQLAAERMAHRLAPRLGADDAALIAKSTQTIVAQVEALKGLVNAFGEYARPPKIERRPIELQRVIGDVLDLYEQAGQIVAQRELAALPALRADAGRMRQLVHNLVKNAVEAKEPAVANLAVTLRGNAGQIELVVADDGPGLPPGFDDTWFEPYTTTKPRGTGLGLAIVKRIAEEHGGTVRADAGRSRGAVFTVRLPVEA